MSATTLHGAQRLGDINHDFSRDELIDLLSTKGLDSNFLQEIIDHELGWEYVSYESMYPELMNPNYKAKAILDDIAPEAFKPYYTVFMQMHQLNDDISYKLIKEGLAEKYLAEFNKFPDYMTRENRAKALLLGFDSQEINERFDFIKKGFSYLNKTNRTQEEIIEITNQNLMNALEINWYQTHKPSSSQNNSTNNQPIFSIVDPQETQLWIWYASNFPSSRNKQVNEDYRIKFCIEHNLNWTSFKETKARPN